MKNLIILSMEACGCSEIGALISQVHYNYTRKKVFWNYEISRLHATDLRYNFPKGFSSVYYVNPLDLLKREYDKIIILQREKHDIIDDLCNRNKIEQDHDKYEEFFENIDHYYDLIYNTPITDKRVTRLHLDEFNNYPVAVLSDLFDFLGYPKAMRPLIVPLPINRDWKKRSSILRKGHEEGKIEKNDYTQFVNVEKPNAYKLSSEEVFYQGSVFRLTPIPMVDVLEVLKL